MHFKRYWNQQQSLKASSYESGNQAGSVTGTNSVVCSYGKFQPGRSTGMNSRNTTKMVEHKLVLFVTVIALWTLVTLLTLLSWWGGNTYKTNMIVEIIAKELLFSWLIHQPKKQCQEKRATKEKNMTQWTSGKRENLLQFSIRGNEFRSSSWWTNNSFWLLNSFDLLEYKINSDCQTFSLP